MKIVNKLTSLENNRKNISKSFERARKDYFEENDTLNENEEEDQIFLRPGAVLSPCLNNFNKRTSVDFNQNASQCRNSKSRSMSLPVTYSDLDFENIMFSSDQDSSNSCFQNVSSSNSSLLSPLRKTDFAFCK